jgi:hypothetical protein
MAAAAAKLITTDDDSNKVADFNYYIFKLAPETMRLFLYQQRFK